MRWGLTRRRADSDTMLDTFSNDIGTFLDDFFSWKPMAILENDWVPRIDVTDDEKAVYVKAEIPGIEEKDLDVSIKDKMLTISGEKKEEKTEEDKEKNHVYSERRFGSFHRSIRLPVGVKTDEVKASFKNGLLEIELPKEESVQPRKIDIN